MRVASLLAISAACLTFALSTSDVARADPSTLTHASDIDLGAFCLSGLPAGTVRIGRSRLADDGTWWEISLTFGAASARKAKVYFFSSPRPSTSGPYQRCSTTMDNVSAILDGDIQGGTIKALYREATDLSSNRWQVEADGLNLELGRVQTQLKPLNRGTLVPIGAPTDAGSLSGRRLWITNPGSRLFFNRSGGQQDGVVSLATTDVQIAGFSVDLGPSVTTSVDLACPYAPSRPNQGRVEFAVDVARGTVQFVGGECRAQQPALPAGGWSVAGLSLAADSVTAREIVLRGDRPQAHLTILGLTFAATEFRHGPALSMEGTPTSPVTVAQLTGTVPPAEGTASLDTPEWSDVTAAVTHVSVADNLRSDDATLTIARLTTDNVAGSAVLQKPAIRELPHLVTAADLDRLELSFEGSKIRPRVTGSVATTRVQWGALVIADQVRAVPFDGTVGEDASFHVDFRWDVDTRVGHVVITDPAAGDVALEAQLQRLRIEGAAWIGGAQGSRLEVKPGGLVGEVSVAASSKPILFSGTTEFGNGSLRVSSAGGFTFGPHGAQGAIDAESSGLIVTGGHLSFASLKGRYRLNVPLRTAAAAVLRFDLATGQAALQSGQLAAEGIDAAATSDEAALLGGVSVIAPQVTLQSLTVVAADGLAHVRGKGLIFSAREATHADPPFWHAEFGDGQQLRVDGFSAELAPDHHESVAVSHAALEGVTFAAAHGAFRSPDGFAVRGDGVDFTAAALSDTAIAQGTIHIATGAIDVAHNDTVEATSANAAFRNFSLTLDGTAQQLSGRGAVHIDTLWIHGRRRLDVGECSPENRWKLTGAVDTEHIDLTLEMAHAALSGSVHLARGRAYVVNDGYSRCEFDKEAVLVEERTLGSVPCLDGWSVKMCDVKSPRIAPKIHWVAELHQLQASATVEDADLTVGGGRGLVYCLKRVAVSPPVIVANYTPTIPEINVPIVGDIARIIRDLIRGMATLFESTLASGVGTGGAMVTWLSYLFPSC